MSSSNDEGANDAGAGSGRAAAGGAAGGGAGAAPAGPPSASRIDSLTPPAGAGRVSRRAPGPSSVTDQRSRILTSDTIQASPSVRRPNARRTSDSARSFSSGGHPAHRILRGMDLRRELHVLP